MAAKGSAIPRRQLGRIMREMRKEVGLTLVQTAKLMGCSPATVQRLETGSVLKIDPEDIEAFCRVMGADKATTMALKWLAEQGDTNEWFHKYTDLIPPNFDVYMGLESAATRLASFQVLVPGLLQTADYARSLIRVGYPNESAEEINRRVEMRMHRQILIKRKYEPTRLHVVLDQSVLHRRIGSPRIMAAQLRHLADIGTRPNLSIRVLPWSAGVPLGDPTGPFTILDFGETPTEQPVEPPVVYVESYIGAMYFEDKDSIDCYRAAHATLARVALDDRASRDRLRQVAREYVA
ncbi:helix-turn-helix domain-containing protein [Nocardia terpenica]|uniref:Helix-turn-helix domain-containing protein n=1 Tax=Nocardia terpenica TaxID=455432 RepID=A0A6G9Z4W4_9NOCA|nr:helix-turn-helix transcriptional regulator [Nocardia terpenica]QIS20578.1 helix-turn-helix domain-containing protein [Nocardia terpenica]